MPEPRQEEWWCPDASSQRGPSSPRIPLLGLLPTMEIHLLGVAQLATRSVPVHHCFSTTLRSMVMDSKYHCWRLFFSFFHPWSKGCNIDQRFEELSIHSFLRVVISFDLATGLFSDLHPKIFLSLRRKCQFPALTNQSLILTLSCLFFQMLVLFQGIPIVVYSE